jgi:hypothetical protein
VIQRRPPGEELRLEKGHRDNLTAERRLIESTDSCVGTYLDIKRMTH